jgi:hypothetical protein
LTNISTRLTEALDMIAKRGMIGSHEPVYSVNYDDLISIVVRDVALTRDEHPTIMPVAVSKMSMTSEHAENWIKGLAFPPVSWFEEIRRLIENEYMTSSALLSQFRGIIDFRPDVAPSRLLRTAMFDCSGIVDHEIAHFHWRQANTRKFIANVDRALQFVALHELRSN